MGRQVAATDEYWNVSWSGHDIAGYVRFVRGLSAPDGVSAACDRGSERVRASTSFRKVDRNRWGDTHEVGARVTV